MPEVLREVALKAVLTYLKIEFPFLNIPVISQLTDMIVSKVFNVAYKELALCGYFISVDIKTEAEQKKFDTATIELHKALDNKWGIDEAKQKYKDTLRDLIRIRTR